MNEKTALAAVVLHGLIASGELGRIDADVDEVIKRSFDIADSFVKASTASGTPSSSATP